MWTLKELLDSVIIQMVKRWWREDKIYSPHFVQKKSLKNSLENDKRLPQRKIKRGSSRVYILQSLLSCSGWRLTERRKFRLKRQQLWRKPSVGANLDIWSQDNFTRTFECTCTLDCSLCYHFYNVDPNVSDHKERASHSKKSVASSHRQKKESESGRKKVILHESNFPFPLPCLNLRETFNGYI